MTTTTRHRIAYALLTLACLMVLGIGLHTTVFAPPPAQVALAVSEVLPEPETPEPPQLQEFIEITGGCDSDYAGECVVVRSTPSRNGHSVTQLRTGVVLKVAGILVNEYEVWYQIHFDEWLRYPERVGRNWYIRAQTNVRMFEDIGAVELTDDTPLLTTKYIVVDRSDQALYAYENDVQVFTRTISTGLLATPTPRGTFTIFKKTPTRYMQGPLPGISTKYFDLPGVPWNLYFTHQGAVVHGAYWHTSFGKRWSNGCVNIDPKEAEALYHWADLGTPVYVRD